ncbi:DUF6090 family protein [Tamlana flava]|uniref:DUF6090 family protein n=1 Tax=Tamlana flava TaxID=3158572 RepID=UPI00351AC2C9
MIKFFRKIRQKLLSENKFSKYLIYAIGEIILVVIGILIALSINNWNENKKAQLEDVKFLSNLRNEIQLDTTAIFYRTNHYAQINDELKQALQFLNRPTEISENERQIISMAIVNLPVLTSLNKNVEKNNIQLANGTLLNINEQLSREYESYILTTKYYTDVTNKLGQSLQLIATRDVHPYVDLDYVSPGEEKVYFNFEELKSNRLLKNAINKSIRYRGSYILSMELLRERAIKLLNILNEELKQREHNNASYEKY